MSKDRKKLLFVINTLGRAGAEKALLELTHRLMEKGDYEISVYVLLDQGELAEELPKGVRLLNRHYSTRDVLTRKGRRRLYGTILRRLCTHGAVFGNLPKMFQNLGAMRRSGKLRPDKLLWRALADGADRMKEEFDLAVAYIEGGSTYYVADYVKAKKKAAFVHTDYIRAGYTRELDEGCYGQFDRIFQVSDEAKNSFLKVYPEYADKSFVFHNFLDFTGILAKAEERLSLDPGFRGTMLLSVGRLVYEKAYDIAIEAMGLLKASGVSVRWYVLGEGDDRQQLEELIDAAGLSKDFLLLGSVQNPYPYFKACDIYVHMSRFEGKSIAIQEAQVLGCTILASDCDGNREQIQPGVDGVLCQLSAQAIRDQVLGLIRDPAQCKKMGEAASKKLKDNDGELDLLLELL